MEEAAEGGNAQQHTLEEGDADKGGKDAEQHVDDVMVAGVDGCPPDAGGDEGAHGNEQPRAARQHGIDGGHKHISRMERGNHPQRVKSEKRTSSMFLLVGTSTLLSIMTRATIQSMVVVIGRIMVAVRQGI